MVKGHLHKMMSGWLAEFTDLRDTLNKGGMDVEGLVQWVRRGVGRGGGMRTERGGGGGGRRGWPAEY
jgi:hypothetical protein